MTPVKGNFVDQKPHVITEACLSGSWGGPGRRALKCVLCGKPPVVGGVVRWVYTNDERGPVGNPFVCDSCDGPDVRDQLEARAKEFEEIRERFWWFLR